MLQKPRFQTRAALAALLAASFLLAGSPEASARRGRGGDDDNGSGGDGDSLTLRINSAVGQPGGVVAVVLRTYAPRPVRQGQVSFRVRRRRPGAKALTVAELTQPVRPLTFLSAVVYSQRGDSSTQASLTGAPDSQTAQARFQSPSATVNASDGPLAVFRFRLDPSVTPGQEFDLEIDPAQTNLVDEAGRPVTIEPRGATLTVRAKSAPLALEAEGDEVEPGETAELGVQTAEPFPISSGQVALRYDARLAGGPPVVRMDPRYGRATFTVDRSTPGLLVVRFQSPDKSLNTVPGTFVAVDLPTSASAAIGATSRVTLDPARTWLVGVRGRKLKLKLENDSLEMR